MQDEVGFGEAVVPWHVDNVDLVVSCHNANRYCHVAVLEDVMLCNT